MFKVLVVGQGLAGTIMSHTLVKSGCEVHVIDDGHFSAASTAAAGMWNPIVFKRLNKSWKADILMPKLIEVYSELEEVIGQKLIHHLDVIRIFPDQGA